MTVNLSFIGGAGWQFFGNDGVPLAGGKIYTYAAGTTTPQVTYTSRTGTVPNTNPIILDAAGRTPEQIWSTEGLLYKYVVMDANNVVIRTWDNIGGSVVASDLAQDLASTTDNSKGDALVGFKQANASGFITNAVARTVSTKLQEVVSVKDFGAVGDGITNDTPAINNAINYMSSQGGGIVYVPEGTYGLGTIGSFLAIVLKENVWLKGAGRAGTILRLLNGANARVVQFEANKNNMQLSDLTIDGNKANQGNFGIHGLRLYGNANILVSNVRITNSKAYGIGVAFTANVEETVSDGRFENLIIDNNGNDGFDGKRTQRCVFQNIYTYNNAGRGIDIRGAQNIYDNVWAYNNGATGISFRALGIIPAAITQEHYFKATNCYSFNNQDLGYFIANNEPPLNGFKSEYDLVNCHAYNNATSGFGHRGTEMIVRYVNCTAKGNTQQGFRASASNSDLTTTGVFTNCVAIDNGSAGFLISNGVGPHTFSNCVAKGNTTTTGQVGIDAPNCQWIGGYVTATNSVLTITSASTASNLKIIGGVFNNDTSASNMSLNGPNTTVIGATFISDGSGTALRLGSTATNSVVVGCDFTRVTAGTTLSNGAAATTNVMGCSGLPDAIKGVYNTNSVNYFSASSGITNVSPQLEAVGSDTNIDIRLTPKGTGKLRFGTLTASADAPISGYIEVKDAAGVVRKLAVIS